MARKLYTTFKGPLFQGQNVMIDCHQHPRRVLVEHLIARDGKKNHNFTAVFGRDHHRVNEVAFRLLAEHYVAVDNDYDMDKVFQSMKKPWQRDRTRPIVICYHWSDDGNITQSQSRWLATSDINREIMAAVTQWARDRYNIDEATAYVKSTLQPHALTKKKFMSGIDTGK